MKLTRRRNVHTTVFTLEVSDAESTLLAASGMSLPATTSNVSASMMLLAAAVRRLAELASVEPLTQGLLTPREAELNDEVARLRAGLEKLRATLAAGDAVTGLALVQKLWNPKDGPQYQGPPPATKLQPPKAPTVKLPPPKAPAPPCPPPDPMGRALHLEMPEGGA